MKKYFVLLVCAFILFSSVIAAQARVLVKDDSVVKINEDINMGEDLSFKDLVAIKGNINVKGKVRGDVVSILGDIHVYPSASVKGDVVSIGGKVVRDEGSKITGDVTVIAISKEGANMISAYAPFVGMMSIGGFLVMKALMFLGFVGLSMVLVSFFIKQIGSISSKAEKEWLKTLLWGILGYVLILPIAALLAITIVGIPLIAIEALLVSVALIMGYVAVAQLIGKKFTKAIKKPNQPMMVEILWGLVLLFLIDLLPAIGPIVKFIVVSIGFGSAIITKLGTQK